MLLFGQLVSLMVAVTSFTASYIAELGVDVPLTQSLSQYVTLSVVYGSMLLYRQQKLLVPWYWYIVLVIFDIHGNYLAIQAYQYSSITSVTLLSSWTIPWVIILTWFVLQTRYSLWQLLGAAICMAGFGLVLLSDEGVSTGGGKNLLLGDILIVAGTFCFALSNVGEEFCVKRKDLVEVLAMLGVFGVIVILFEILIFERKELASIRWSPKLITMFAAYATAAFLTTTTVAFLLKMSGATLVNLSLLTTNMWAVLIRIFFYRQQVTWLYYLSFAAAAIGLIVYSLNDATSTTAATNKDEEATIQYPLLQ